MKWKDTIETNIRSKEQIDINIDTLDISVLTVLESNSGIMSDNRNFRDDLLQAYSNSILDRTQNKSIYLKTTTYRAADTKFHDNRKEFKVLWTCRGKKCILRT